MAEPLGRLKPGVTRATAEAELRTLAANIYKIHPENTGVGIVVEAGSQGHNARIHRPLD